MHINSVRRVLLFVLAALLIQAASAKVVLVSVEGTITEGTYVTIQRAVEIAENQNTVLLVELNTPGGLLTSTQKIVQMFLSTKVPVVVYVPKGALCASAGTIILLSSDVAAVANGTAIGAATPISAIGGEAEEKTVKYFASYVKSIAEERNRNPELAEKIVTEALSLTAEEAYKAGLIDYIVDSRSELLKKIDGAEIRGKRIEVKDYEVIHVEENIQAKLMNYISDPIFASILLLLGIYLLIFGLTSPGVLPETLGAICLVLALYGLSVIQNVDYLGIALILLGIILLIAELMTPTYGVLGSASVICIVLGMLLMFKEPFMPIDFYGNFLKFILGVGLGFAALMTFAVIKVVQSKRKKSPVGEVVGETGEVIEFSGGKGFAKVRGEIWKIESKDDLKKGDEVLVLERHGLTLKVKKLEARGGAESGDTKVVREDKKENSGWR